MVRPGIMLYGYYPEIKVNPTLDLKPVMEFRSPVTYIKEIPKGTALSYGLTWESSKQTKIATISVGYADGYNRNLSNKSNVWINGKVYPQVGRVCMDQILMDIGMESSIETGDYATLFGPEKGQPDAWELATLLNTIPYEITCGINHRVKRFYVE
jgi:alanine racemase